MPQRDVIRAAGYARVSTEEQAREGYGLDAQRTSIEAYCKAQGWSLVNVYIDAGVSGSSQRGRLALAQLLAAAESKSFERVVFWKLDRLSRSLRDVLELSDRLEKQGVQIVSIQEGIDAGTPTGRMYRNIIGTMAEFERETITERIEHGLAEKARQGELLGPVPVGYVRAEDGAIRVDAANAELVRQAFERYATGRYSLRDMAAWSRDVGFRSKNGRPLDRMAVGKILRNVSYTGVVAHHRRRGGGVVADAAHPAIVAADLFERVSQTLTARSRDSSTNPRPFGRSPYPLSATAICGACGAPLSGGTGGKHATRYMRCSTAARNGKLACRQRMVAADLLEAQIGAYVSGMLVEAADIAAVTAQIARQQAADPHAARRLRLAIERWQRLYAQGEIDEDRYRDEVRPLQAALDAGARPASMIDAKRVASYLKDAGRLFSQTAPAEQRRFVREVFERIVVSGEQVAEILPRAKYMPLFVADRNRRFNGDTRVVVWLPGQDSNLQPIG